MQDIPPSSPASPAAPYLKPWLTKASLVIGVIAGIYSLILGDLWLRGRDAYLEGEKYMRWHQNPQEKRSSINAEFNGRRQDIERLLRKGRLSEKDFEERLELLEFDQEEQLKESSVKYAYIWYQTAVELFSPPESKWVKLSRQKMPQAKELWKQELLANKIPFEDYMLE
ncbi:MAG: hypothetical protein HY547_06120 [Elusimicrobia bacterium]|nr:hypothetical protein [Elusimicrobiota bacterium]